MNNFENNASYFDVAFKQCVVPEASYNDIEFDTCRFVDCDFSNVKFQGCKFINCEFERCNLSLVNLARSRLFGVAFYECKLVGVDWTKALWPAFHLDFELKFERCILNDSSFLGLTLNELILEECKLHDVDFRQGNFTKAKMTYCDFTHSLFMRTNLQAVDFTESSGYAINVLENTVTGAKFSRFEALSLLECLGIELVD